ncbi:MAG: family 10 glycosylhydrolase [Cyanobacteria bacterium RU_5_0]|nr:family 10 glycosylhydrolase [Cyanobacteria bacterium RU_5_0]
MWKRAFRSLLLLGLGLTIALIAHLPTIAAAQSLPTADALAHTSELRGVWLTNIDSDVLFSKDKLEQGIGRLARLNFNTIYPTVWNEGHTLYPSAAAEEVTGDAVDPIPEFEDRDMLEEAIELSHEHGLAVIPWFEFGLMAPEDSELVKRHPAWVMSRKDGTQVFVHGDQGQHRFVWLNPAHPDVQEFMLSMVIEVVTHYDIDGIQFDDHFGTPIELGYDDYTVSLYQQETGKRPPADSNEREWMQWRARKVSDLMVRIFSAIKTRKPDCLISLSPNPRDFSYRMYLQNWYPWVDLGFIDELIVQVYRTDLEPFTEELDRPELQHIRQKIPVGIGILVGLRVLNVEMRQIEAQVRSTRDRQFAGISFFFYETLGDRDAAFQTLFPSPVSRPDVRNYAVGI